MPAQPTPDDAAGLQRRELRAMNSDIELVAGGPGAGRRLDRAEHWLPAFEARFSRFRLLSELSRLNAAAGRPYRVSPAVFRLVSLALELARRSDGLFDPTVLRQLEAAGYDASFDALPAQRTDRRRAQASRITWRDVSLDASAQTITLPAGAGIDLGGIGKGWAVDRLASILGQPSLVNGGGDVFASGRPPDEPSWQVGIADPFAPERDLAVLRVVDRGVATSSSLKRRWSLGGAMLHHLIDPRTGRPSASDAVQVTVVAANATLADFHAKVALLQGAAAGVAYLNRAPDVEGLIVRSDGVELRSEGLQRYL